MASHKDVKICIAETSHALPPDGKAKIFDLFYYPAGTENWNGKTSKPDTGLGLAFLKTLIEHKTARLTWKCSRDGEIASSSPSRPRDGGK